MNIDHDEHGPVDVDALMVMHNERMKKQMEMSVQDENSDDCDEPTICKSPSGTAGMDSQEYVCVLATGAKGSSLMISYQGRMCALPDHAVYLDPNAVSLG